MHPLRNIVFFVLLSCPFLSGALAQNIFSVSGSAFDASSDKPVPYASMALYSMRDSSLVSGGLADERGFFSVTELPRGRYWCTISFIGYETWVSEPFGFRPDQSAKKDLGRIALQPAIHALDEAEVVTEQSSMEMLIDRRVFHVGSDLTSTGANAAELLTRVPSVQVDIDGNVSLRGSSNVQILIDGRPSGLSGPAGQAFLAQIPSQTIDRVEIITNPSARFDPDGMAGILNIVLRKNKLAGFNGMLQVTPATGGNSSMATSLNYRDEHWNFFSNLSVNHTDQFSTGTTERVQVLNDSLQTLSQRHGGINVGNSLGGRLGMEWTPTEGSQFSIGTNFNQSEDTEKDTLENDIQWGSEAYLTERRSLSTNQRAGWDVDLGYRKTYDNNPRHTLEISLRTSENVSEGRQELQEELAADPAIAYEDFNGQSGVNRRHVLAVDYKRPLANDGRLEWGFKSNISDQQSQFNYLENDSLVYTEGLYIPFGLDTVDYAFRYREDIHATYATWGQDWGAWGMQLGSRLEQAFTAAELSDPLTSPFTNDYFSWYPSANLSYQADDRTTWSASYSRRVNRPHGRQVNPYIDDSDAFNVRTGNPELRPEYTHSFEVNRLWTKERWSVSASMFHKRTQDVIRHYSTIQENGVRYTSYANLASRHDEGLEFILSAPLWKASSARLTGEVYHLANEAGDLEAATNAQGWTHNWSVFANLAFGPHWKGQINGRWRGASVTPQGRFNGMKTVDLAAQRSFLDGKLNLSVRLSDAFDTRQWSYNTDLVNPAFYQDVVRKRESRNIYIDLRWSFGKLEESRRGRGGSGGGGGDFDGGEF